MQLYLRNFLLLWWNGAILCPLWALLPSSTPVRRSPFPFQRILDVGRWWLFFEAEKKHVATRYFCESSDSDSGRKCFSDSFAEWDWESLCKLWMECISLTSTVQTEALRGIGIYRWQGGEKKERVSTRFMEQPFSCFIFTTIKKTGLSEKWFWKGTEFLVLLYFWSPQSWRKSMISSSSCYSSETAEWAKHVWSYVLLRTISTPHTFPPSVRCLGDIFSFQSTCLHQLMIGLCGLE